MYSKNPALTAHRPFGPARCAGLDYDEDGIAIFLRPGNSSQKFAMSSCKTRWAVITVVFVGTGVTLFAGSFQPPIFEFPRFLLTTLGFKLSF